MTSSMHCTNFVKTKHAPEVELGYLDLYDCAKEVGCKEWVTLNCMLEEGLNWGDDVVCTRLDCDFLKDAEEDDLSAVDIAIVSMASVNLFLVLAAIIYFLVQKKRQN
jgi:hypothetical protein